MQTAEEHDSTLVSIHSEEENNFVKQLCHLQVLDREPFRHMTCKHIHWGPGTKYLLQFTHVTCSCLLDFVGFYAQHLMAKVWKTAWPSGHSAATVFTVSFRFGDLFESIGRFRDGGPSPTSEVGGNFAGWASRRREGRVRFAWIFHCVQPEHSVCFALFGVCFAQKAAWKRP